MTPESVWESLDMGTPDECWPWTLSVDSGGYGRLWFGGRTHAAHRVAYELTFKPIPEGLEIDHTCHNEDPTCPGGPGCPHRRCCNPWHLEPVTPKQNGDRSRLTPQARTHCPHGHPYEGSNLMILWNGGRACRTCINAGRRRRRAAKRNRPETAYDRGPGCPGGRLPKDVTP